MTETSIPSTALDLIRDIGSQAPVSFEELAGQASVIPGRTLVEKDEMIGVPHIITKVSFRPDSKGGAKARDFVSVEAVDHNNRALVYNDSSTGVRRQVVEYLQAHKLINPKANPDDRISGNDPAGPSVEFDLDGDGSEHKPRPLGVPRGLTRSDYVTPEFGDATTYYLA